MNILLKIIDKSKIREIVFRNAINKPINSESSMVGNTNYICGNCGAILIANITPEIAILNFNYIFHCSNCDEYNKLDVN